MPSPEHNTACGSYLMLGIRGSLECLVVRGMEVLHQQTGDCYIDSLILSCCVCVRERERNGLQNCCWTGLVLVELWRTDLEPCFVTAHIFKLLNYFNREVSIYSYIFYKKFVMFWLLNFVKYCFHLQLTFRHRAFSIQGQAFHYSPENAFYIFNQQIYFII